MRFACVGGVIGVTILLQGSMPALSALPPNYNVNLAWNPSPSIEVTGYRIYYGVAQGGYTNSVTTGNVTNAVVTGLVSGLPYYFAVAGYNAIGLESELSNEIGYTVPGGLATLQIRVATNKQAILTVTGLIGHTYEIQATSDLKTWTVLGTVTLGSTGLANYTNTNAGSFAKRYYRTRDTQP